MMRFRRSASGRLEEGAGPGRGAWLCRSTSCVDAALSSGALGRALRGELDLKPVALRELLVGSIGEQAEASGETDTPDV